MLAQPAKGIRQKQGNIMKYWIPALSVLAIAACTSVKVKPVDSSIAMKHVCIRTNPAVAVDDFVMVIQDGFQRHGIAAEVYDRDLPASCEYVVDYTALRSWDFKPYLSHAEIRITEHGRLVASATYHLNGKGGFDMGKWRGTKAKMDPVMDELLAGFH
jgi:hypothetical protein